MNYPDNLKPTPFLPLYGDGVVEWTDVLGFAMPLTWGDVPGEYGAIRNAVAAIEFSVLLKYEVKGPGALATVDAVYSRDVAGMAAGKIAYGVIVTDEGYMIDDCTVFVHGPEHVQVIGGSEHIGESLLRAARPGTVIAERRGDLAQLAVQGPNSRALLQRLTTADLSNKALPYYNFITGIEVAGIPAQLSRLGFTGELGYEVIIPVARAADLWAALTKEGRDLGFRAAGGAALMTVRMEAGLLLSGLDYGPGTTPLGMPHGLGSGPEEG
jgi:aminomethyltransferase